jgi:hypothetical protein
MMRLPHTVVPHAKRNPMRRPRWEPNDSVIIEHALHGRESDFVRQFNLSLPTKVASVRFGQLADIGAKKSPAMAGLLQRLANV